MSITGNLLEMRIFSAPTLDLLNQNAWQWDPISHFLISLSVVSDNALKFKHEPNEQKG